MLFSLEKTPSLPFMPMNDVHHEELEMVNHIFDFLLNSKLEGEERTHALTLMLKEFLMHVKEHFSYEEELMAETKCPIIDCHRDEHNRVLKLLIDTFREFHFSHSEELLRAYLEYEFKEWILNHIATMDTVTATYFDKYEKGDVSSWETSTC